MFRFGQGKKQSVVRMKFHRADAHAKISGAEPLPGRSNYFLGSDPARWRTDIPHYARVVSQDIYPGIDLIHYGARGQLEFDFVVHPGADPGAIQLRVQGARQLKLNDRGDVVLSTSAGDVLLNAPVIYQQRQGARQQVAGGFLLRGKNRIAFHLGPHDSSLP